MSNALSIDQLEREAAGPLVNMRELAIRLRVSRQTITVWLDKWADFPVVFRGTNGTQYQFDASAVFDFLREKKESQLRSTAARDEALAQLTLPFAVEPEPQAGDRHLSTKDRIEAIKLARLQREEAERTGQLVVASEVADHVSTCLIQFSRTLHAVARAVAQDHNLPDAVERSIAHRLAEAQRQFVRDMTAQLAGVGTDAA